MTAIYMFRCVVPVAVLILHDVVGGDGAVDRHICRVPSADSRYTDYKCLICQKSCKSRDDCANHIEVKDFLFSSTRFFLLMKPFNDFPYVKIRIRLQPVMLGKTAIFTIFINPFFKPLSFAFLRTIFYPEVLTIYLA